MIVGLIQLTKLRNDFTDPTVTFTRYELLKLLGWEDRGWNYRRLSESLHRWAGVTLRYNGCWWDNKRKRRASASFHILDEVVLPDEDDPGVVSSFTWGKKFFKSCRDGNIKRLDLTTYFALKSAISKQLYRFLDKRFYLRNHLTFDLRELAHERVGLSRTYGDAGKLKAKLQPALEELEAIGFLEPMSPADRYSKTGRGAWNIRFVPQAATAGRGAAGRDKAARAQTDGPGEGAGGARRDPERGRRAGPRLPRRPDHGAARAVGLAPGDEAEAGQGRRRLSRRCHPEGLRGAGRLQGQGRAGRGGGDRAGAAGTAGAGPAGDGPRGRAAQVQAYWAEQPPDEQKRLEAAALAGAAPGDRAVYEAATGPARRLLQVGLRDAHLRRLLGLPAAD